MNATRLLLLAVPIISACYAGERAKTGHCPVGEVCSPRTPQGLQFVGATFSDILAFGGPSPTAIGGTQRVNLEYGPVLTGGYLPLTLPFNADDGGGSAVKVEAIEGSVVVVRGAASGSNLIRITDAATGELFDRKTLEAAAIDSIQLAAPAGGRIRADAPIAFAAGNVAIAIALEGTVADAIAPRPARLVDESMIISTTGGHQSQWDVIDLDDARAGVYPISITAGNRPTASVEALIVDHLDSLTPQAENQTTIVPIQTAIICFDPMTAGHFVSGAAFQFTVTGIETTPFVNGNCVVMSTEQTEGQVSVEASAMGVTATATLPIAAARVSERVRDVAPQDLPSPAGDRAAM